MLDAIPIVIRLIYEFLIFKMRRKNFLDYILI